MTTLRVTDLGAVGDGQTLDTAAIQAAIDQVHESGGGTVVCPGGRTYLTGSLVLRSYVELHVERGAVVQGSPRWSDYHARFRVGALSAGVVTERTDVSSALLTATDAVDVAITGGGVIDGAGAAFITGIRGEDVVDLPNERPFLTFLLGCVGVTVRDVTLRDSALWCLRLTGCRDVVVSGVRISNDVRIPNSDGIDLDRCRRVRISDCDIVGGDDGISLKTCDEYPEFGGCEDVTVTGCLVDSRSSGLVVGVDVSAPIRNVVFSACVVRAHRGLSVSIGTAVEGTVADVLFSDIVVETRLYSEHWWGGGEPIYVRAAPWHEEVGTIRNVRFRNILARGEGGAVIYAARPGLVEGVTLDDVRLELGRSTSWPMRRDLRPVGSTQPAPAVVAALHVERAGAVTLRDCTVRWTGADRDDYDSAVRVIESPDLRITGLDAEAARLGLPTVDDRAWSVLA